MSIPGYQDWFMPLLKKLGDQQEHRVAELDRALADEMGLSEEERREKLPSGRAITYKNRIGWARTYLGKAGLIKSVRRGYWQITECGLEALRLGHEVSPEYLKQFEGFREFQSTPDADTTTVDSGDSSVTPEEQIERAYATLRDNVESELLEAVKSASPDFFEKLVVDLLLKMGYGGSHREAGQVLGGTNDAGVDGVINEDRLGLDVVYIQAKRWEQTVGRPTVQEFAGSLDGKRAKKGVLITTSDFSAGARDFAAQIEKRIVLVSGRELVRYMFDHDLGVNSEVMYERKSLDSDYFQDA